LELTDAFLVPQFCGEMRKWEFAAQVFEWQWDVENFAVASTTTNFTSARAAQLSNRID
jgi:hypothetical protein